MKYVQVFKRNRGQMGSLESLECGEVIGYRTLKADPSEVVLDRDHRTAPCAKPIERPHSWP